MDNKFDTPHVIFFANLLDVVGIIVLLILTFMAQFIFKELPCPLCLLQRAGFLMTGTALLMNLRFGLRPSHYAIALLSTLFTVFVALRQIVLHIQPNTGAYGSAIFGWHLYTWSFVIAMVLLIYTSIILGFDTQYRRMLSFSITVKIILVLTFISILVLAASNLVTVLHQCGLKECPSNPSYSQTK